MVVEVTFSEEAAAMLFGGDETGRRPAAGRTGRVMLDENNSPPHSHSRELLVALMDRKKEEWKSRQYCCSGGLTVLSGRTGRLENRHDSGRTAKSA